MPSGARDARSFRREAVTPMERHRGDFRQRRALRPSQLRLTEEDLPLPARLYHLRDLPWLNCYKNQLKSENKSANTQKSYVSGLRAYIETTLPGEDVLSEVEYESMSIHDLAQRMDPCLLYTSPSPRD